MGASTSKPLAEVTQNWLLHFSDSSIKSAYQPSLAVIRGANKSKILALAYAASEATYAGSPSQHIRFALSKDGGETWTPSRSIMWGLAPLWGPVLHYDAPNNRLLLFYCESRKALSPGGDIKYICSSDKGESWNPPVTIFCHESIEEVPKVCANSLLVTKDGRWYLPIHTEPVDSHKTFNTKTYSSLKDVELPLAPIPGTATKQGVVTWAGVLVSDDFGASWELPGQVEDEKTWLIEPTILETSKGQLLMLFRTAAGKIYSSLSADKGRTWSKPAYTSLPNPNAKFSTVAIDNQILCAYNASPLHRAPLALAISDDDGRHWEQLVVLDGAPDGNGIAISAPPNLSFPCIVEWSEDTVKVAYVVFNEGIKLATAKLATVD